MEEAKLRYGRWVLVEKASEEPYLTIGRWVLRIGDDGGRSRKAESEV